MGLITIAGIEVEADDPCALWQALYAYKLKILSGEQMEEVEIRSPVTTRRTRFTAANMGDLEAELARLQAACEARSGRRRRFAVRGTFRPLLRTPDMAALMDGGKLRLSGYVGDYYFEDGFTSADVVHALAEIEPDAALDVHLNSPGGIATEGAAIHALLAARPGATNIVIEGIAASSASLIAMAGDTVTMAAGAIMMIHDPSSISWGTAADHEKTVEQLDALGTAYARIYAAKSGKTPEEAREVMKRETWLTPDQAVAEGFADRTTQTKAAPVAAFDYRAFARAPRRLVTMARQKNWSFEVEASQGHPGASEPRSPRQIKEPSMTDKPNGGDEAAELARLREENATMKAAQADRERRDAIMALPEAQGRTEQAKALADAGVSADQAKAVLVAGAPAPDGAGQPALASYQSARAAGAGLGGGGAPKASMRVDIVESMKRRFGVKS